MVTAIFGLLGVVLGGLLTAGTQLALERRRERHAHRAARMLVAVELLNAVTLLTRAATLDIWVQFPDVASVLPTAAWRTGQPDLVVGLDRDTLSELVVAYGKIELVRAQFLHTAQATTTLAMKPEHAEQFRETVVLLQSVYEKLVASA